MTNDNNNEKPDAMGVSDAPTSAPLPKPELPATNAEKAALPLQWVRVTHHTPDHLASRYLYAGYGSNLALEQMVRRCSQADIIGPGILRGSRLVFAYHLGIVEDAAATTLMGVYRMTAADIAAMDRYEALGRLYDRFLVTVEVNGVALRCFTYVKRNNDPEQPSDRYYETCLQGYRDWNFDARRLRHARDFARKHEKPKAYGHRATGNGWASNVDWRRYGGRNRGAQTPIVPTMDGSHEPIANGSGESYRSLVTGRQMNGRGTGSHWRKAGNTKDIKATDITGDSDPMRTSVDTGDGQAKFTNPRTGEGWAKGSNGVWYRVKD